MFKFLKLHSSSSGDARRHVPFASIIHKHIFPVFFVTILFLTLCFRPYAAEALAQLAPEIQPVYDTTIESLYEFVKVQLDDTHKQVFDLFLGSYMVGYAGMSQYELGYVYNSDSPVKEWLINTGADLYNTILSLGGFNIVSGTNYEGAPKIGAKELTPLLQYAMGCAIKSKQYTNADDALNDIQTSDSFPIPLKPDIMFSINAAMGYYDGLYNWQFSSNPFTSTVSWNQRIMSGVQKSQWDNYYNSFTKPVRCNPYYSNTTDAVFDLGPYSNYNNLFFNTSNNTVKIVDSNGNQPSGRIYTDFLSFNSSNQIYLWENGYEITYFLEEQKSFNLSNYNTFEAGVQAFYNSAYYTPGYYDSGNTFEFLQDFIEHVYYGSSWNNKQEIFNITDKNLEVPDAPTYYPGVDNGLLDLKGLLEDILGELQLRPPVINNYYYPNGDPVPVADMEPAMQNITLPESGVDIDQDLFSNLFRSEGKDTYISYLWYMTKPLILYTRDLFDCLIFDPVENFAASGPGYFVYGVVSLGLISGLIVKCLL